jgi:lysophospholipase L1-like esterase
LPAAALLAVLPVLAGCGDSAGSTPTPGPSATATPPGPAPGEVFTGEKALYLALGDSLSEGIRASDPLRTGWVPLVATELGDEYELLNLGVAGHDSQELIEEGPLETALAEIRQRENDSLEGNETALITLEIGGNDLLDLYFDLVLPGVCPTVEEGLRTPQCVNELRSALTAYVPNLERILSELEEAAPETPIYVMTLYNPFSGGSYNLEQIGILALEGRAGTVFAEGLNDLVRKQAREHENVTLVEWYEPFLGKQGEYISLDFIHPNDAGYRVLADAVLAAIEEGGLP